MVAQQELHYLGLAEDLLVKVVAHQVGGVLQEDLSGVPPEVSKQAFLSHSS